MKGVLVVLCGLLPATISLAAEEDAPVWQSKEYVLAYNPAGAPAAITDSAVLDAMVAATEAWAPCGVTIRFGGYTRRRPDGLDGSNVLGWETELPGLLALTEPKQIRRILLDADIRLSAALVNDKVLLRRVLIHEVGHGLGLLMHSADPGSIMYEQFAARGTDQPAPVDLARCRERYRFR